MKQSVRSLLELEQAIEGVLKDLSERTGADAVTFHLYDSERDRLILPVGIGLLQKARFKHWIPRMDRIAGKIARLGKAVIADDAEHHSDLTGPFTYLERVKSAAGFPLVATSGDKMGVLFVNYRDHKFLTDEVQKLEEETVQIADTLQGWLTEDLKAELRSLPSLRKQEAALGDIAERVRETLGNVTVAIWMPDKPSEHLVIRAHAGLRQEFVQSIKLSLVQQDGIVTAFLDGQLVRITDIENESFIAAAHKDEARSMRWKSALVFPLQLRSQSIGVFCVYAVDHYGFTAHEERLVEAFVAQAAITLENEQKIDVLNSLHDIGTRLTFTTTDSHQLLNEIVKNACLVTGADIATVNLYDFTMQEFYDVDKAAAYGTETVVLEKPASSEGLGAYLLEQRFLVVEDVEQEERDVFKSSFVIAQGIRAFVGVCLSANKQTLGVLFINFKEPQQFTSDEIALIKIPANYAATAIHNATLLQQVSDHAQALRAQNAVAQELVAIREVPQSPRMLLERIAQSALEVLNADTIELYEYYQAQERFNLPQISVGEKYGPTVLKDKIYKDDAVFKLVQRGEPLYEEEVQAIPLFAEDYVVERVDQPTERYAVREGLVSVAAILLKAENEIVGAMFVNFRTPQAFAAEQQEFIESYVNQAAIAIHNARLYARSLQRAERLNLVREIAATVSSVLDIERILQLAVDGLSEVIAVEQSALVTFDEDGEYASLRAEHLEPGCISAAEVGKIPLRDSPSIDRIKATKSPLVVYDAQSDPILANIRDVMERRRVKSIMIVPIVIDDEVVGTIGLDAVADKRVFTREEVELAQIIANQVAVAIENVQAYAEVERQHRELQIIDDIGKLVMSSLDAGQVPRRLLQKVVPLFEVEGASLWNVDYEKERIDFLVSLNRHGQEDEITEAIRAVPDDAFRLGKGIVGLTAESGKPMIVNNVKSEPEWNSNVDETSGFETQSILAIPLIHLGKTIGVIELLNKVDGSPFTQADQDLMSGIAVVATIALDNARLFGEAQQRVEELETLQRTSLQLTSTLDLSTVLDTIAENALTLVRATDCHIYLYDEATETFTFGTALWEDGRREAAVKAPRRNGFTATVVRKRRPVVINDAASHSLYASPEAQKWRVQAIAGFPLKRAGRVLGVFNSAFVKPHTFSEAELRVLGLLADQAVIAIENAQLYEDVQHRLQDLSALNEVGQTLTSGIRLEQDEILELIYEQAIELVDAQDMFIALYDDKTNMIRFGLAMGAGKREKVGVGGWSSREADMEERGKTEDIILTKKPILHKTLEESTRWYEESGHKEFLGQISSSWMGVPMVLEGRVMGVIAIYDMDREYAFDSYDLQVVSSMASQAAIALDNVVLYHRRVRDLDALSQIGQTLTSGVRLTQDEILKLIYDQARGLTGTRDMYVALYDESSRAIHFSLAMEHGERVQYPVLSADMKQRGKTEEIILTKRSILHRTKEESEGWYQKPGRQEFLGRAAPSWLGVPMMMGERLLGVIATYDWDREYAYDEYDLQVVESMASQAAVALEGARLYNEVARRVDQVEAVQEISNAIKTYADLPEFLKSILEMSLPRLNAQTGTIQLFDEIEEELVVLAEVGLEVGLKVHPKYTRITLDKGITGQAARERQTVHIPDTSKTDEFLPYLGENRSEMASPMMIGDQLFGILNIEDPEPNAFDEDTQELLELIAAQAAIAIQQKKRLQEEEEKRVEAEKEAMVGKLTRDIGHHVKNKVGIIRLSTKALLSDSSLALSSSQRKKLEMVLRNAESSIKLASDLFEPYKTTEPEQVNVNWLIEEAMNLIGEQDDAGISSALSEKLPNVLVEKQGLVNVFQELMLNALKAVRRRSEPRLIEIISQVQDEKMVEVLLVNNGPPIPREQRETIFEQFSIGDENAYEAEGFGLGLWGARVFIRRQNGDIWVLESDENKTTFVVHLPVPSQKEE